MNLLNPSYIWGREGEGGISLPSIFLFGWGIILRIFLQPLMKFCINFLFRILALGFVQKIVSGAVSGGSIKKKILKI